MYNGGAGATVMLGGRRVVTSCASAAAQHAVLLTGYSTADGSFSFKNSFGASWGQAGFGRIALTQEGTCGLYQVGRLGIRSGDGGQQAVAVAAAGQGGCDVPFSALALCMAPAAWVPLKRELAPTSSRLLTLPLPPSRCLLFAGRRLPPGARPRTAHPHQPRPRPLRDQE